MAALIQRLMGAARQFTVLDFACLKITLISFGILLGAYFAEFFLAYTSLLWLIFIVAYFWIMYKIFMKYMI